MSVQLRPLGRGDFDVVAHIRVAPEQERFSGTVAEAFDTPEPAVDFHAIWQARQAVGFFKIDRAYASRYAFASAEELGLRAFLIDLNCQGRGIATRAVAALRDYVPAIYPGRTGLVLTVNKINPAAVRCYLKGGFSDTGQTYPLGQAGPQHVMRMKFAPAA